MLYIFAVVFILYLGYLGGTLAKADEERRKERQRCIDEIGAHAVAIEGTPYICGPRKWCDKLREGGNQHV